MAKPTIEDLRERARGAVITADDPDYDDARKVYNGMIDRRPRAVVRCADAGDVMACGRLRARERARPVGPRRRPQRAGLRHERRRRRDRPLADERRPRRPADADGARRGRLHLGRLQPRDVPVRPGDDRRDHLDDRHRRAHARRRDRLPLRGLGLSLRQPALGRRRHRRRPVPRGERAGERGSLLGAPRRWRQLRRRDVVRVPAAPGQGHLRRPVLLPARRTRATCSSSTASYIARRARGAGRVPGVPDRAAAAVHPREASTARRSSRSCSAGPAIPTRARRRSQPIRNVAPEGRGDGRADAVSGDQRRVRPAAPARPAALLEGDLRHRAHRRRDRRRTSSTARRSRP